MHFRKRKENKTLSKRTLRMRFCLAYWPNDAAGWLRIPSMITGIAGILGVAKYTWLLASRLLKSVNMPPVEFCWLMLGVGGTVYLLSIICGLFFDDVAKAYRPQSDAASSAHSQWRSL
jgi:hypothetical protein